MTGDEAPLWDPVKRKVFIRTHLAGERCYDDEPHGPDAALCLLRPERRDDFRTLLGVPA